MVLSSFTAKALIVLSVFAQAERRNGKTPVECSRIEHTDPENAAHSRANVYDEIPADSKTNGRTNGRSPRAAAAEADPVYTQPVKRERKSQGMVEF